MKGGFISHTCVGRLCRGVDSELLDVTHLQNRGTCFFVQHNSSVGTMLLAKTAHSNNYVFCHVHVIPSCTYTTALLKVMGAHAFPNVTAFYVS